MANNMFKCASLCGYLMVVLWAIFVKRGCCQTINDHVLNPSKAIVRGNPVQIQGPTLVIGGSPVVPQPIRSGSGNVFPNVVGGSPITARQRFPWQVLIKVNGYFTCGGSLVHPCFVLTAKHCILAATAKDVSIVLGELTRSIQEPAEQHIAVKELIEHPDNDVDVAILQLSSSATLTNSVQVIPMAQSGPAINSLATVTGWGQTESNKVFGGAQADILQYLEISIVDKSKCVGEGIPIQSHHICAGKSNGPYSNACYGDSGGPFAQVQNGKWTLIGVVQGGKDGCPSDSNYARYENVASSYSWIYSHLPKVKITNSSTKIFSLLSALAVRKDGPLSQTCPA